MTVKKSPKKKPKPAKSKKAKTFGEMTHQELVERGAHEITLGESLVEKGKEKIVLGKQFMELAHKKITDEKAIFEDVAQDVAQENQAAVESQTPVIDQMQGQPCQS